MASKVDVEAAKEMLAHGWGVNDVAQKFGVSRQQIWRILKAADAPPKPPKPPKGKREEAWKTENRGLAVDKAGQFIPAGRVASDEQMEAIAAEQTTSLIYAKDVDTGDKVSLIIHNLTRDLADVGEAIRFDETDMVKRCVFRYLQACEKRGAIPGLMGLSRCLGVSSTAMKHFMRRHPDHPTTHFLELVLDAFSDALQQATLSGSTKEVYSIFLQKALYQLRDNEPVRESKGDPLGEHVSTTSLMDKYATMDD